jgi:hypothetical protein
MKRLMNKGTLLKSSIKERMNISGSLTCQKCLYRVYVKATFLFICTVLSELSTRAQPWEPFTNSVQYTIDADNDSIQIEPCEFEQIVNTVQKREVMERYIQRLYDSRAWDHDKGIITIDRKKLARGKEQWMLNFVIDDRYKDNPARHFSIYDGDIILIYNDSDEVIKWDSVERRAYVNCLETVIGDRVYNRPEPKWRWSNMVFNGQRLTGRRRSFTGRGYSSFVVFKKDGSYEVDPSMNFE